MSDHGRTPWSVTFDPKNESIIASGCLAGKIVLWDWKKNVILRRDHLYSTILSLSFNPSLPILLICSGDTIYYWEYEVKYD